VSYLDDLSRELGAVGIGGARRRRIVREFADHLSCDPAAQLGAPGALARQFADELGTGLARRAAFVAFAALSVTGAMCAVVFLASPIVLGRSLSAGVLPLDESGAVLCAVAAQTALVAGSLGLLRAWRRRDAGVLPRAEAVIIGRRAGVGLAAGVATLAGVALVALGLSDHVANWWVTLTVALAGAGTLVLAGAGLSLLPAARIRPVAEGSAGDLFDDLTPLVPIRLQGRAWLFAVGVAAAVALVIALLGVAQGDPFDGLVRGIADGAACLAGFAVLGRYLGLR
jgi:hypothetical protein